MKLLISTIISLSLVCVPFAGAQTVKPSTKHSVKPNVGIGLGKAYSTSSSVAGIEVDKSSSTSFRVDYRYQFWQKYNLSLGINVGLSYSTGSMTLKADNLSFDYTADAAADMDGDTYQRHTTIRDMSQKVSLGEFGVPVYVDFNWQIVNRFAIYAEAGLGFRFSTTAKVKDVTGTCDVYGIYPKYDNLKMDDEWLNDFGDHSLSGTSVDKPQQNPFTMNLRVGAGFRIWIAGPLSIECGVNYNYGFMNRLKSGPYTDGNTNTENAPMTYTLADGRNLKASSLALGKSRLSNLNATIGLIFSF